MGKILGICLLLRVLLLLLNFMQHEFSFIMNKLTTLFTVIFITIYTFIYLSFIYTITTKLTLH